MALSYFWGVRGTSLAEPLGAALHPATGDLLAALSHPERAARAQALGAELARVAAALERRGLLA